MKSQHHQQQQTKTQPRQKGKPVAACPTLWCSKTAKPGDHDRMEETASQKSEAAQGPSGDVAELQQVLQTIRQETSSPPDTAIGQLPFLHGVLSDFLFFIRKTHPFKRKSIREYWKNFTKFSISSGSAECRQKQRVRTRQSPEHWSSNRRHSSQGGLVGWQVTSLPPGVWAPSTIFSGKSSHLLVDKIVKEMTSECKSYAILYREPENPRSVAAQYHFAISSPCKVL